MKKQTKPYLHKGPHYGREQDIKGFFLIIGLIVLVVMVFGSCSAPRYGCKSTWEMSGYNPKKY